VISKQYKEQQPLAGRDRNAEGVTKLSPWQRRLRRASRR
jgi:hypothetical protein